MFSDQEREWEPHVYTIGEFEIELLVAYSGIVLVEFEKLSLLEEKDSIPKILFDFPETPVSLVEVGEYQYCFSKAVKVFHALVGM